MTAHMCLPLDPILNYLKLSTASLISLKSFLTLFIHICLGFPSMFCNQNFVHFSHLIACFLNVRNIPSFFINCHNIFIERVQLRSSSYNYLHPRVILCLKYVSLKLGCLWIMTFLATSSLESC